MTSGDDLGRRIAIRWKRFSPSWDKLADERREVASKVLIIVEMLGGRGNAARLLEISDNTLDNYRHGVRELKHTMLRKLAEHAGLPLSALNHRWILQDGRVLYEDEGRNMLPLAPEGPGEPQLVPFEEAAFSYPFVQERAVARPGFADDGDPPQVPIFSRFWDQLEVDPKNIMVLIARDDSMAPTVVDGAPVFIDMSDRDPIDGCVYVFRSGRDLIIRRVRNLPDGELGLICDNRAFHPPQRMNTVGPPELQVVGRVRSSSSVL